MKMFAFQGTVSKFQRFTIVYFIVCLSFLGSTCFAQLKGRVLSAKDQKPIAFATVYLKKASIGIHSDENGYFDLATTAVANDTLYIQLLGYKTLHVPLEAAVKTSIFYLEESPIQLPTLTIGIEKGRKTRSVWKGAKEKRTMIMGQLGGGTLQEVAVYIPNDEFQEGFVEEVGFYISMVGKPRTPFRVRIYEPDDNNMPGRDLLTENVVTHGSWGNKYCFVNLSKYNIPFGNRGIFVSMEWLMLNDKKYFHKVKYRDSNTTGKVYGQEIGLTNEFEELRGRIRTINNGWKVETGFVAPMFRAKIQFYEE